MKWGWMLVLLTSCFLVYGNSFENSFHYDDEHSIQHNIHIRSLENVPRFFLDPATFSVDADKGMYRPLLLVTYALNYAWGGNDLFGYHLVNVLLHGLNACLVYWLAGLLLRRRNVALLAGLLFALHPLATEPVNYISSRSESLAALFFLLGMGSFISGSEGKRGWMILSWLALALGLLSKSTVITLPAVLLVYDYLFVSRRDVGKLLKEGMPRLAPHWIVAGAYLVLVWTNGFLSGSLARPVRDGWTQFLTQIKGFAYYQKLLFWPLDLNVEHQFFEQKTPEGLAFWGALALVLTCLVLLVVLFLRHVDRPLFLALWGLIPLLPVMVMPLNVLVNERRLYLTCAAFCIGLAMVLHSEWLQRFKVVGRYDLGSVLGAVVLVAYGGLTYERNQVWISDFSLWGDAVEKAELMPRVHLYLGNAHKDSAMASTDSKKVNAHWQAAIQEYRRTIELDAKSDLGLRALNNLGAVHFMLRDIDRAEEAYRQAVEYNPRYADALGNLGSIYHERARMRKVLDAEARRFLEQAIDYYRRALGILPNKAQFHGNLGLAYFDLGDLERAQQAYERAYFLNPADPMLLNNMGNLLITQAQRESGAEGRRKILKARELYLRAQYLNPAYPSPLRGLQHVDALLKSGRW